jgi:UDP-N-acetylglucosamine 2-epimerase (non-hydrolysing)
VRVLVVLGTRPEAIKLAPVIICLRQQQHVVTRVCLTGQHRQMLDSALRAFDIEPDLDLNIMQPGQDLTDVTTACLVRLREALGDEKPDWVLVQGDTTTALSAALAAYYQKIPIAHVEAGLRTYNPYSPWPEEINRRLVDAMSAVLFPPTRWARDNLLREAIPEERIHVTGNTVIDALFSAVTRIETDRQLRSRIEATFPYLDTQKRLLLVTGHRRESFGSGFEQICTGLVRLADRGDVQIVYPVHLNPNVREPVRRILGERANVRLIEPLDYLPFVYLLNRADLVLTDSGGIQEEAPSLGKPVLVMRDTTERPEAIEAGTARLVGADAARITKEASVLLDSSIAYTRMARAANPFGDGRAAHRICTILLGKKIAARIQ